MTAHELGLKLIQNQYSNSEVWYLEVIGIHPLLQSCGLGRRVMEQVFEYVGDQCIALECTNERNIGFYEKLGFRIVQEVQLDGDRKSSPDTVDTVKYWLMVRDDSRG
jgi:ribosomal protein S18 acetylase RimI-like enzyme